MSNLSGTIEELNLNFKQFSMLVDLRLEEFAEEKIRKLEELQPLGRSRNAARRPDRRPNGRSATDL